MIEKLVSDVSKVRELSKDTFKENLTPKFFQEGSNKENLTPKFFRDSIQKDILPDINESKEIGGGAYKDIPSKEGYEKHHVPANSVSPLEFKDGPCISMTAEDHKETASFGNSKEAQAYRAEQKRLIDSGDFQGAFDMDVQDVRDKFRDKYDTEIYQAQEYINKLKDTGVIINE